METVHMSLEQVHATCMAVLQKYGCDEPNSQAISDTMTGAERDHATSHGIFRLPGHVTSLKNGNPDPDRPGMHAVDLNTGAILWSQIHEDRCNGRSFCHPGISQAASVVGDLVIAGSMDGVARAYRVSDGEVVWELDTTQSFESISGELTEGGSFGGAAGPIAFDDYLVLSSGYDIYNHMRGNLLLVLRADKQQP